MVYIILLSFILCSQHKRWFNFKLYIHHVNNRQVFGHQPVNLKGVHMLMVVFTDQALVATGLKMY